jgi:serine phosphatase RsbU (regulator of sigma subunit)
MDSETMATQPPKKLFYEPDGDGVFVFPAVFNDLFPGSESLRNVCRIFSPLLRFFSHSALYLLDERRGEFAPFLFHLLAPENRQRLAEAVERSQKLPDSPLTQRCIETGSPFFLPDVAACVSSGPELYRDLFPLRSLTASPIFAERKIVGAFAAGAVLGEAPLEATHDLLARAIADSLGQTFALLRRQQPIRHTRKQAETQRRLEQITRTISQTLDSSDVLKMVCGAMVETLGFDRSGVYIVDPKEDLLRGVWETARGGDLIDIRDRVYSTLDSGAIGGIVRKEIPYLPPSGGGPVETIFGEAIDGGLACLPLVANGEVVGLLSVDNSLSHRPLDEEDLAGVQPFCDEAAVAIRNARLHEELQRKVQVFETLLAIGNEVRESMDPETVLLTLVVRACEYFRVSECSVFLHDNSTDEMVWRCGVETKEGTIRPVAQETPLRINRSVGPLLFRSLEGLSIIATDGPDDPRYSPTEAEWARRTNVGTVASIPLYTNMEKFGVLTLLQFGRPVRFSREESAFQESLAHHASVALQKAQLLVASEEALDRANTVNLNLRKAFVPDLPPEAPGLDIGHVFQPASQAIRLGGDFYDLFRLGRNRYGFAIGDVSGHDLDAAVQTAAAKYFLRAYAERTMNTETVVRRLNEAILNQFSHPSFISLFYGVIDLKANALFYANAGHEPPLLLLPNSAGSSGRGYEIQTLLETDPLIAIDYESRYTGRRVAFPPGALLALYTDGLTESRREGQFLLTDGIIRNLPEDLSLPAQAFATTLWERMIEYADRISDDVAILALKRIE